MMRPISLKMPRHLAREVSEAARRRGVSRSALIREALETFLRRERAAPTVSALSPGGRSSPAPFPGRTTFR